MGEFKNLLKVTAGFMSFSLVILVGLRRLAGDMGAGSSGYRLSVPFLVIEMLTVLLCYFMWYRRVNRGVANMINIAEMRKRAFRCMIQYAGMSGLITGATAGMAYVVMVVDIFNKVITPNYYFCSVGSIFVLYNIALLMLMRFVLPDRVTGSY